MPTGNYPQHDINQVFDYIHVVLNAGGVADNALDEMSLINRLFSALPVQAVEYGMQFLHGNRDLPKSCDEILPLYVRFVNLVDYCETIVKMRNIPSHPTPEELAERVRMNAFLDELEKPFCTPLLGFSFNKEKRGGSAGATQGASSGAGAGAGAGEAKGSAQTGIDPVIPESAPAEASGNSAPKDEKAGSSNLHLMNDCAPVFVCKDALATALFYETKLGFSAAHLDDESMPHIRLNRDNIHILLVQAKEGDPVRPLRELYGIPYDLYIYVSEPMMLQLELSGAGVPLVKTLEESDQTTTLNREFVFEDNDGRHICVSTARDPSSLGPRA